MLPTDCRDDAARILPGPQRSPALQAVLDSLSKWAGPEDPRSNDQWQHDALEEACRWLIAAGTCRAHLQAAWARGVSGASV
jgi:Domain of unknown function (DUF222)